MKKTSLLLATASLFFVTQAARATISITATPSSQTVTLGSSFTISLSLAVTQNSAPANVTAYDLYLATVAANSGYFSVTAATPSANSPFTAFGPTQPAGGDPLSTAAATGYVRNGVDEGYSGTAQATPFTNLALETLTLSVGANVPQGTYTFQTTTMATANVYYSDVSDTGGTVYEVTSPGVFSINVVPEPSTWVAIGVGAGLLVLIQRRRRHDVA